MTIVGKLICKALIKVYGFVEGELNASNALIADGARIEGEIVAEELTVAGRVKGDIHALRVKLQGTAVVEGDIFHRVLSMHENARFEGCSRPEDAPPEPPSSINAESLNPLLHDQRELRGPPNGESKQGGGRGVQVFFAACLAIITIGVMSSFRSQRHTAADRARLCDRRSAYRSELDVDTALTSITMCLKCQTASRCF